MRGAGGQSARGTCRDVYCKMFSMLWKRLADYEHFLHVKKASAAPRGLSHTRARAGGRMGGWEPRGGCSDNALFIAL